MRLLELKLQDFGVYQGTHTFDLQPRNGPIDERPIIIFGGKNGAGKTTLLEAIRLCLYGRRALGGGVGRRVYQEYVTGRIHRRRGATIPVRYAAVTLRFEYAQFGILSKYEITRGWEKKANGVVEQLAIYQDGNLLTGMAEDRWQDFVEGVIPSGVANLFFFDGEKIQSLAADNLGEQTLGEEIKRLLGLNLVERLQADLDIYLYRQRKESAVPELTEQLEAMQKVRDETEVRYQTKRQGRAQTQAHLDHARGKLEQLERQISQESSGFALKRDQVKMEQARVEAALEQAQRELQTLAGGLLPFTLVPELTQQLKTQLQAEARHQQWQASQEMIRPRIREMQATYQTNLFWQQLEEKTSPADREAIVHHFDNMLAALLQPTEDVQEVTPLHQVSEPERYQLLNWIEQAAKEIPRQVHAAGQRLEALTRQRKELALHLRQVPEDDILKPLMTELNTQHQKLGELESQAERQDQELRSLDFQRQEANRKLKKAYDTLRGGKALERRLGLVINVQTVLGQFLERLTQEKVLELEILVAARFNDLSRKPDLVQDVAIDPDSFQITLKGRGGEPVPKAQLSAGEKQMFAIAVLWALRQLSGRPFPIVIDTPLGRLDSDHRANLVAGYFPYISHQVILFSTDTEVDQDYFKALKPHISHAYHLDYDAAQGATRVREGYFWNEVPHATE